MRGGDIEICRLLLESGAQAFADGDGPLAVAARDGRADICRLLIAGGASFEAAMDRHIQPYEVEEILARLPADATDIARALCAGQGDTCMLKKVRDSNHGLAATFQADAARSKPPARLKPRLSGG